jgi:hypothetical protein
MIYRSIMMVILMLSITWLTDPNLFAGVTPSGNEVIYGSMSPKKDIDPKSMKPSLLVQIDVKEANHWKAGVLKYEVREYTAGKGILEKYFFNTATTQSAPQWFVPKNQFTIFMKVVEPNCVFGYIGPPPSLPNEIAKESDSDYINIAK